MFNDRGRDQRDPLIPLTSPDEHPSDTPRAQDDQHAPSQVLCDLGLEIPDKDRDLFELDQQALTDAWYRAKEAAETATTYVPQRLFESMHLGKMVALLRVSYLPEKDRKRAFHAVDIDVRDICGFSPASEAAGAIKWRLSAAHGLKGKTADLFKAWKLQRHHITRHEYDSKSAAVHLGCGDDFPSLHRLKIPKGYEATQDRVQLLGDEKPTTVVDFGMAVAGVTVDVSARDDAGRSLSVVWHDQYRWKRATVPFEAMTDYRKLAKHVHAACITQGELPGVARYLKAFYHTNGETLLREADKYTTRLGWTDDCRGFVTPTRTIGNGAKYNLERDPHAEIGRRYTESRGTLDGWIDGVWRPLARDHYAATAFMCSVGSLLIDLIPDATPFVFHIGGRSGRGKSTLACAITSSAAPKAVQDQWDSSKLGIVSGAAWSRHHPYVIDEMQLLSGLRDKGRSKITDVVYGVANEGARRVMTRNGEAKAPRPHARTIVVSTGESKLADRCNQTGASARVLDCYRPAWTVDGPTADTISRAAREHYGHLLPRIVEWILAGGDDLRSDLKERWKALEIEIDNAAKGADSNRAARYGATLALAAHVMREAIPGTIDDALHDDIRSAIIELVSDVSKATAKHLDAYDDLMDVIAQRRPQFATPGDDGNMVPASVNPQLGFLTDDFVYWIPAAIGPLLDGYAVADVLMRLVDAGIITRGTINENAPWITRQRFQEHKYAPKGRYRVIKMKRPDDNTAPKSESSSVGDDSIPF